LADFQETFHCKKCLILLAGHRDLGALPPACCIWCRTALVLFQRAAERVFGKPLEGQ
jgi:hypothetical protein